MREASRNQATVAGPFCSRERGDKCETAVRLLGLIIHMIGSMPWVVPFMVTRDTASPLREMSTAGRPLAPIHANVTLVQKCEAIAAMNFATRLRPETSIRAVRTTPRPSE
jgi:hypothetical protein